MRRGVERREGEEGLERREGEERFWTMENEITESWPCRNLADQVWQVLRLRSWPQLLPMQDTLTLTWWPRA